MSMFIVSENTINDVANLIIKLYPYMDLNEMYYKLLKLNIEVWNNKYNLSDKIEDYDYKVINYNDYITKDSLKGVRFVDGYVEITQLVESLKTFNYQIDEEYIKNLDNRMTYSLIRELLNNPLVKEINDFIKFNGLENEKLNKVRGVVWDR